jgi:hypothetical protein
MALYVVTNDNDENQWHVGERKLDIAAKYVIEIQADGDELEKIKREVAGIPMTNQRVVRWFGDDAKFIYANIVR